MFQCFASKCFSFLISNTWSSYKYFRVKMSRCHKGKNGIFNARDGQISFPKT
jgi:hypothetical protein